MLPQTRYDVLIIGGGHNGLVAACYLAKAGKTVLLLEAQPELGGATTSVQPFPEYAARLSRYSYLVSLFPDQIVADLGIQFPTLGRAVASYTPYQRDGRADGLLVSTAWDQATADSFQRLTGSAREGLAWREFYGQIAELAKRLAPTLLQPLQSAAQLKAELGLPEVWRQLIERPIGEVIRQRFRDELVQGVVLTDALIGTFVAADDLQANRCFLYHLIGNGTGQWRVPQGGMGALIQELARVATRHGVQLQLQAKVAALETGPQGVRVSNGSRCDVHRPRPALCRGTPTAGPLAGPGGPRGARGVAIKNQHAGVAVAAAPVGRRPASGFCRHVACQSKLFPIARRLRAGAGRRLPQPLPLELYCHTLTDPSILSAELRAQGFQTLTLFGFHTPAQLFDADRPRATARAQELALASLNEYLLDPIESVLAPCHGGGLALEVKSPLDLEQELFLPRGNIFHRDLEFPFLEEAEPDAPPPRWGAETDDPHLYLAGAGARRGGGVSGIAGHNAAMALLTKE